MTRPLSGLPWVQRGFALVTAIFLLVVLAGLAVAMMTFTTAQHTSSGMDVMGARAYQAARAGVEWGLYQRLNPLVRGAASGTCSGSFALPTGTTLSTFTVTVTCTSTTDAAPQAPLPAITITTITATACNQPSGGNCPNPSPTSSDYVQRVVQVTVQK